MSLKKYAGKRDFKKTPEPRGGKAKGTGAHRFVIQKHAASHLHYDFRLEMGGTLKSWAVPKGMPYEKGEKRLAMQVEDHPLAYIDFEGTIPKGQYGGGTVMVWDTGTYEPLSKTPMKELQGGKLHFMLHGKKLEGEWYLVRMRKGKEWLLIKGGQSMKRISARKDDTSSLSGRSMKQLAAGRQVWNSDGKKSNVNMPLRFVEPMKAKLVDAPPSGKWCYEIKFDGYRAIAMKSGNAVQLLSRNRKDFGEKFPEIAEAVGELSARDAIIDGEVVALDKHGLSSFQLLQALELGEKKPPLFYYVFDLLRHNGKDLKLLPLSQRKAQLAELVGKGKGLLRYSASIGTNAQVLMRKVRRVGIEGLIGKRQDSHYEVGKRTGAWIKLKFQKEQEVVLGGYTDPAGSREHFGALLMGVYEKGKLKFAGKVGTGFDRALLGTLHAKFSRIRTEKCPFSDLPVPKNSRWGTAITAAEMKRCHWLKPKLVAQVKFAEWTRDHRLRQPVFIGLREDKAPRDVVRETPS